MEISLLAFALAFGLAFANGTNDVSKAIATLVGSGVTDYRSAIAWGTVWTVVGAGLAAYVASAMIKTFSHGLVQTGTIIGPTVTLAVLAGRLRGSFLPRAQDSRSRQLTHSQGPLWVPASSPSPEKNWSGPRSGRRLRFRYCSVRSSLSQSHSSSIPLFAHSRKNGTAPACA